MDSIDDIQYLESLVSSREYLARAARAELEKVKNTDCLAPSALLRARAFVHAHVGMNDQAVLELNALVSETNGADPQLLNKLAQVRLRRLSNDDVSAAKAAASRVLEIDSISPGDKWLAHQNLALANWVSGNIEEAMSEANLALEQIDDPRSRTLVALLNNNPSGANLLPALGLMEQEMQTFPDRGLGLKAIVSYVSRMEPIA